MSLAYSPSKSVSRLTPHDCHSLDGKPRWSGLRKAATRFLASKSKVSWQHGVFEADASKLKQKWASMGHRAVSPTCQVCEVEREGPTFPLAAAFSLVERAHRPPLSGISGPSTKLNLGCLSRAGGEIWFKTFVFQQRAGFFKKEYP